MAWIESHQSLKDHPKVADLMAAMGWDLDQTLGKLHRFWWWCVDYAEDGDLRKHNDNRIAQAMGVATADARRLVEAMVAACWLDRQPYFRVHNWWEYAGRLLYIKYKEQPEKWKTIKAAYAATVETTVETTVAGQVVNAKPTNQPNQPNQPTQWRERLCRLFNRTVGESWTYAEESQYAEMARRPAFEAELTLLEQFRPKPGSYFPQSLQSLLNKWSETVDRAKNYDINRRNNAKSADRNQGTANEGQASKFAEFAARQKANATTG